MNKITVSAFALLALGASLIAVAGPFAKAAEGFAPDVGANGSISVPAVDFRKDGAARGTYAIAGEDGASGLVYLQGYPIPRGAAR